MIYTTTTRYAVLMLAAMGSGDGQRPNARQLAAKTGVPYPYLTKIAGDLVKKGILKSSRGRGGGLTFARSPEQISLFEVVEAVEGPETLSRCLFGSGDCDGSVPCPFHPTWAPVRSQVLTFLRSTTISKLATLSS